jgi:hypothetical protein
MNRNFFFSELKEVRTNKIIMEEQQKKEQARIFQEQNEILSKFKEIKNRIDVGRKWQNWRKNRPGYSGTERDYHRAQGGKNRIDKYVMEEHQKEEQVRILQEQKEVLSDLKEVRIK